MDVHSAELGSRSRDRASASVEFNIVYARFNGVAAVL
jgi:hypothetical protein